MTGNCDNIALETCLEFALIFKENVRCHICHIHMSGWSPFRYWREWVLRSTRQRDELLSGQSEKWGWERPLALLPCLFSLWACKNKPPASASGPNRRQGAFVSLTTFETAGQSVEEWQSQSSSHICSSLRVWVLRFLTDQHYTPP